MPQFTAVAAKPGIRVLRLFSASWACFLWLGAFLVHGRYPYSAVCLWLLGGGAIFAAGIFVPTAMRPVYLLLERSLHPLGNVVSTLMLALVYFGLFTLFATVLRLARRDALRLNPSGWGETAWMEKSSKKHSFGYFGQY